MARTYAGTTPEPPQLTRFMRPALIIGAVALVAAVAGAFISSSAQFFQSYLYAFMFWFALSMGGLGLLILQYLVGGRWGQTIKRILEAIASVLPLMAILFLPIAISVLLGDGSLYPWNRPAEVAESEILQHRAPYMNAPFFFVRAVIFFAIWLAMVYFFTRWSREQDRTGDPRLHQRLGRLAGVGVVIFVLSYSFAVIDWGMTTEKFWYSTMYPVLYIVTSAVTGMSFSAIVLSFLYKTPPLSRIATAGRFHDLGSLMFAFTVLWTYVTFSQYLIMFSANISEEAEFYVHRAQGGWQYLGFIIGAICFVLPFFLLLSRRTKRAPQRLRAVATGVLIAQMIYIFWQLVPAFHPEQLTISWIDIVALIGIGGLWFGTFLFWLGRRPLVTENDPRQAEALEHHHDDAFEGDRGHAHA